MIVSKFKKKFRKARSYIKNKLFGNNNIFLVYTMSKVGSTTISNSLKKDLPNAEIYDVHFLSQYYLTDVLPKLDKIFHNNIKKGNNILAQLDRNKSKKIKIITLVRDPIMREISGLLQTWQHLFKNIEDVENEVLKNHIESLDFNYSLNWFDDEFYNYLNIDIYSLPFNKKKGFDIYKFENLEILCIKLESLSIVGEIALKKFTNKRIRLVSENQSINKSGYNKYAFLKDNVKIDQQKLNSIYTCKYMTHFYTNDEIDGYIRKWSHFD